MQRPKNHYAYILTIITFFTLQSILSGCATQPKEDEVPEVAAKYLLIPKDMKIPGFYHNKDTSVFENDLLRISVRQLNHLNKTYSGDFLKKLHDQNYIFLEMEIENKSDELIIYNPAHTAFLAGSIDYKKPLDYPDLYQIARNNTQAAPELQLSKIRNLYYDLNTSVQPNSAISKIFIFYPVKDISRSGKLMIRELYIGTETIDLTFLFWMKIIKTFAPNELPEPR
jgi:hypothetical protein